LTSPKYNVAEIHFAKILTSLMEWFSIELMKMAEEKLSIVVVEDDASMSRAIKRILQAGGYIAVMFGSAEEALESEAMTMADCLVLDIRLPGMSGFDLCGRLPCREKQQPVVIITAHDEPAARAQAAMLGAKGFVPKPFSGRELLDAVVQAIDPV
jgi:FixJ family two-component response regulator